MNEIDQKIANIKRDLENVNSQKVAVATKLKALEEEKEELLRECHLLNVDPQKIEDVINEQEEKIKTEVEEIKQMLEGFGAFRA